jgi:hypothetical protein
MVRTWVAKSHLIRYAVNQNHRLLTKYSAIHPVPSYPNASRNESQRRPNIRI